MARRKTKTSTPSLAPPPDGENHWLTVVGARQNNLRDITVEIPLQRFVGVTGVSGSGKSSLVNSIIYETLARDLNGAVKVDPGDHDEIRGVEHLDKVIDIDQSPIGRTPRSNPATYIKVFDLIRSLYSQLPDAKVRGYKPGRFSFNVNTGKAGGGRCESCEGNGANKMEMDFLADVWVTCPVCSGKRFSRETLQILYRGKSIADVLDMDIQQALTHFENQPKIANMLQTLHDVGLDYMKLGQSSTTLSGGEAQRIKLARELVKKSTGRTLYILDEPTTGLHFDDIKKLLTVLHGFVDAGNSVIVIEHNLDVIKTADWIIDLGPEGGAGGGCVIAEGTPEKIARSKKSHTGAALRELFDNRNAATKTNGASTRKTAAKNGAGSKQRSQKDVISVVGAQQHNLKNISVDVPRGKMTVCSGPSGSGKSSFAIDTIYTEGQRRYVESLSSYARQFIGQLQPPKVDHVDGLAPSICIEQKAASKSPRSTVGTVTEIFDYMRILWARLGQPYCPKCKIPIGTQSSDQIVDKIIGLKEGTRALLLAPVSRTGQESYQQLFTRELANGYTRVCVDGEICKLDDPIEIDARRRHEIDLVIDRIVVRNSHRTRISDSVEQSLSMGNGIIKVQVVDEEDSPGVQENKPRSKAKAASGKTRTRPKNMRFSQHFSCDKCGTSYDELTPHHFSFNSRMGWCEACEGLGTQRGASPAAIIVHPTLSILDGAVAGWGELEAGSKLHTLASSLADAIGFDPNRSWNQLSEPHKLAFLHGTGEEWITASMPKSSQQDGSLSEMRFRWRGFYPAINRATRVSWTYRKRLEDLVTEVACESCCGSRLRPESAAVQLKNNTIHDVCLWPLDKALSWFKKLRFDAREKRVAGELLHEIISRLEFLVDVGLDYVSLHRTSSTLSGGESQRIQLAAQIGTGLTGVLYVLDEPTIGLHPRDNDRLIGALQKLRNLGNTLLVVEHDREVIDSADHILDFGPGAGNFGGEITAKASPKGIRRARNSLTGRFLSLKESIPVPSNRRPVDKTVNRLAVHGARENNLKEIDVEFPLGRFTCVTGVSGSGKSSLVTKILYPVLASRLHRASLVPGGHESISGIEHVDKVINVDQSPIGNSPTSNPATYTGVFDEIRELYAKLPDSKVRGYAAGRFSFNRTGGRCEACEGMGQRCIEMHFLPDVWVECEECKGTRYVPETLEVRYRGKNIAEVLTMTVSQALDLFENVPKVKRMLKTLDDVGLGYLGLGQPAPTLSGGEAQRVKLAGELGRPSTGKTMYILDEPTTGLHFDDLRKLLNVLHRLVDLGNTCICIEHNLDVIKTADHIIDLGPEAADDGGTIVVDGTPEQVASVASSHTGRMLKPVINAGPIAEREVYSEAKRKEEEKTAKIADVGEGVKMPWEADGKRWHTVDRPDRFGRELHWERDILVWMVETIESLGNFAPTDWKNRSRVEMKAPGKGQWFVHFVTGSKELLDVIIRIPANTFPRGKLASILKVKTLDERTDLPIYGQSDRVLVRDRFTHWDEVRMWLRDHKDINKRAFREFLKTAVEAYESRFLAEQADKTKGEPWRANGQEWHLSQQGIRKGLTINWQPAMLMALIGRFKKLQPNLKVDWSRKVAVVLQVPGEKGGAASIVTNKAEGLKVALVAATGLCTPTEIETLGLDSEVKNYKGYDELVFMVRSLGSSDSAQLKKIWRRCRENPVGGKDKKK